MSALLCYSSLAILGLQLVCYGNADTRCYIGSPPCPEPKRVCCLRTGLCSTSLECARNRTHVKTFGVKNTPIARDDNTLKCMSSLDCTNGDCCNFGICGDCGRQKEATYSGGHDGTVVVGSLERTTIEDLQTSQELGSSSSSELSASQELIEPSDSSSSNGHELHQGQVDGRPSIVAAAGRKNEQVSLVLPAPSKKIQLLTAEIPTTTRSPFCQSILDCDSGTCCNSGTCGRCMFDMPRPPNPITNALDCETPCYLSWGQCICPMSLQLPCEAPCFRSWYMCICDHPEYYQQYRKTRYCYSYTDCKDGDCCNWLDGNQSGKCELCWGKKK